MSTKQPQQIEFDVFPKQKPTLSVLTGEMESARRDNTVSVVFSHQSVFVIVIGVLLLLVASFSLGVEKGKLQAMVLPSGQSLASAQDQSESEDDNGLFQSERLATDSEKSSGEAFSGSSTDMIARNDVSLAPTAISASAVPDLSSSQKDAWAVAEGRFTIQVASVKSDKAAQTLADSIAKRGFETATKKSGKFIVVLAGRYEKREDAQAKVKELKKTYKDCFVRNI